jgi:maltoporin
MIGAINGGLCKLSSPLLLTNLLVITKAVKRVIACSHIAMSSQSASRRSIQLCKECARMKRIEDAKSILNGCLRSILVGALLMLLQTITAYGQTTQEIQQQIQQMKEHYEQQIAALEKRIEVLEQSNQAVAHAVQKDTVTEAQLRAATEAAVAAAQGPKLTHGEITTIDQTEVANTPRYDEVQDANVAVLKLQEQAKAFEFHGYLRSGTGLNGEGGQMVTFRAPGAGAKYRLGNEAETYGEMIFVNNWLNPMHDPDKAWMRSEVLIQADTTQSNNYASTDNFRFREAFIQMGNLIPSQPMAKFWAGERYYRRQNIDINDFYILDMSGYGGGVEDLNVKVGMVALAYLTGAKEDIVTNNGTYTKSNLDARLYGVRALGGEVGFWGDYSYAKGGTLPSGELVPSVGGYAFGVGHALKEWLGGYNAISFQYGVGAASNFSTGVDDPTPYLPDAHTFRFTESGVIQPNDSFAVQPVVVYQYQTNGNHQDGSNTWLSLGARPVFFFTEHLSLATELGLDRTSNGLGQYEGWVRKFTIAPQIGAGRKFFSRPRLRMFFTYANWSQGLEGYVGTPVYKNKTSGLSFGLQGESWW